ncbi:MAG: P1 family peptidase [Bdellovibrionota bacterium]
MSSPRKRVRDLGLKIGNFSPGPLNAITDVEGVLVGHSTIIEGDDVRTGVTAILPNKGNSYEERVVGGGFVLNGAGEVSGLTQIMEWGLIETPILLTNTMSTGSCSDSLVRYMLKKYPGIGNRHDVVIPVVGECDDSWLNNISRSVLRYEHVEKAIESASSGPVGEGSVGGGTGMITCDFKAGIGTSSRVVPVSDGVSFTLGVLVMSNFGEMRDLCFDGLHVGARLDSQFRDTIRRRENYGSIIAVLATDAPVTSNQINRLSKRVALGIGRVGSYAAHGSGEIILGFSTANKVPRKIQGDIAPLKLLLDTKLNAFYAAAIEATEEAILNSLCMAGDMKGFSGSFAPGIPLDRVEDILRNPGGLIR